VSNNRWSEERGQVICSPAASWISGQTINIHGGGNVVRLFGE
jgi:hypothetical protein